MMSRKLSSFLEYVFFLLIVISTRSVFIHLLDESSNDRIVKILILTVSLFILSLNFNSLKLEEKKKVLRKLINKNKLYVNYSDIDDEEMFVKAKDKNFTKSFYEDF